MIANPPRIAVAGGYTAGHIMPAIEFLRAYRAEHGAEGYFIGCPGGMENQIVAKAGERLEVIPGAPVAGRSGLEKAGAISGLVRGIAAARALLRREKTQLVIGFGSYAAGGACLAAWTLGIPVVIHEANAKFGRTNRLLFPFSRRVCVAFDGFAQGKHVVRTGTPCRAPNPWMPPGDHRLRVLVVGGSHGSPHLNREAPRLMAALSRSRDVSVMHLAGRFDTVAVEDAYRSLGVDARVEKFSFQMADLYSRADFVVTCAGGACLAEIAGYGIPALLVPLSGASDNHQEENARAFSLKTGCLWVAESEWDAAAQAQRISALLDDEVTLARVKFQIAAWGLSASAHRIIDVCQEVLRI